MVRRLKYEGGITNSLDSDQTAPSSLSWVCTICSVLSVQILTLLRKKYMYFDMIS